MWERWGQVLYPIPSYLLPSFLIHCQDLTKGKAWEARKKTNCRFPNPFHSLSSFVIPLQIKETDECSGLSHHRSLAFAHSLERTGRTDSPNAVPFTHPVLIITFLTPVPYLSCSPNTRTEGGKKWVREQRKEKGKGIVRWKAFPSYFLDSKKGH